MCKPQQHFTAVKSDFCSTTVRMVFLSRAVLSMHYVQKLTKLSLPLILYSIVYLETILYFDFQYFLDGERPQSKAGSLSSAWTEPVQPQVAWKAPTAVPDWSKLESTRQTTHDWLNSSQVRQLTHLSNSVTLNCGSQVRMR